MRVFPKFEVYFNGLFKRNKSWAFIFHRCRCSRNIPTLFRSAFVNFQLHLLNQFIEKILYNVEFLFWEFLSLIQVYLRDKRQDCISPLLTLNLLSLSKTKFLALFRKRFANLIFCQHIRIIIIGTKDERTLFLVQLQSIFDFYSHLLLFTYISIIRVLISRHLSLFRQLKSKQKSRIIDNSFVAKTVVNFHYTVCKQKR